MNANAAGRKTSRATASAGSHERRSAASSADAGAAAVPEHTYHHGNLHETLVLRGIEILDAEGAAALSLRRAAREAGVSQTAPLHHFDGKVGYLAAIATHGFRMLFEERIRALRNKTDPCERLLGLAAVFERI